MKTPKQWLEWYFKVSDEFIEIYDFIDEIQKDAYNQAIDDVKDALYKCDVILSEDNIFDRLKK